MVVVVMLGVRVTHHELLRLVVVTLKLLRDLMFVGNVM
jgi:hypothetical protein